jgi:hypothetical protein
VSDGVRTSVDHLGNGSCFTRKSRASRATSHKENLAPMAVGCEAKAYSSSEQPTLNDALPVRQARRVAAIYGMGFEAAATIAALAFAVSR